MRRARRRPLVRPRRGVSLVELIVAVVVLVIGVLGLAATAGMVVRQMGGSAQLTLAGSIAQSRFERMASLSCAVLATASTGTATTRGIVESWSAQRRDNNTMVLRHQLTYRTNRGSRTVSDSTMRVCE